MVAFKSNGEIFLTTERIDCGIGVIEYTRPDNLLLQQLMSEFEEQIIKSSPNKVLDGLRATDKKAIAAYEEEIAALRTEISELKEGEDVFSYEGDCVIDCGISKVEYVTPDNLNLQSLMETLGEVTKKHGAVYVENILRNL